MIPVKDLFEGAKVRLYVPENPRLHDQPGVVAAVTDWGAVVQTDAAATGLFRALHSEMIPYQPTPTVVARDMGYTGNVCAHCGSTRMIRNGSCETCLECASTSGCS